MTERLSGILFRSFLKLPQHEHAKNVAVSSLSFVLSLKVKDSFLSNVKLLVETEYLVAVSDRCHCKMLSIVILMRRLSVPPI